MNHAGDGRPSVRMRLEGVGRNTGAIGARIELSVAKRVQIREIQAGGVGYLGQGSHEAHFGLGGASSASSAIVRFPDGAVRALSPVPAGSYLVVHPALLGDGDFDGTITDADAPICASCVDAGGPPRPGSPCARFDFNGDLLVDQADLALFEASLAHARADLDRSGVVDSRDLTVLLSAWGGGGVADLDRSGLVDPADLALLLQSWD